jgi:hypothetical protein
MTIPMASVARSDNEVSLVLTRHPMPTCTIGTLEWVKHGFQCLTLEDPKRKEKIPGKTAIPDGDYELGLTTSGRLHQKYKEKFPSFHRGMIEILNVPGFTGIMLHTGNTVEQTEGCPLLGWGILWNEAYRRFDLTQSTIAYEDFYRPASLNISQFGGTILVRTADEWPK